MSLCRALLLLTVALSPVTCLRPFDSILQLPQAGNEASSETLPAADKPWFCHDLDCPKYTVDNQTSGYETRVYEKGHWASTLVPGLLYSPSVTVGFKRLFDYISGENANSTKIPMTSPVLTTIEPGQGAFCKSNFTVSFFVPFEYERNTPQPNSKDVFLFDSPKTTMYVSQFGGYLVDDLTLSYKVKALHEALERDGKAFKTGWYFTASYDPPFRVQHRHNEIWVEAASEATSHHT